MHSTRLTLVSKRDQPFDGLDEHVADVPADDLVTVEPNLDPVADLGADEVDGDLFLTGPGLIAASPAVGLIPLNTFDSEFKFPATDRLPRQQLFDKLPFLIKFCEDAPGALIEDDDPLLMMLLRVLPT